MASTLFFSQKSSFEQNQLTLKHRSEPLVQDNQVSTENVDKSIRAESIEVKSDSQSILTQSEKLVSGLLDSRILLDESKYTATLDNDSLIKSQQNYDQTNDFQMRERLKKLHEWNLMKAGIVWFLIPSFTLGILSLFFPFIYAIIPAHESGTCICSLMTDQKMVYNI